VDWIAAAVVLACLVALAVDFGRRWGRPRLFLRNPWTYGLLGILVAAAGDLHAD
jgi:transposase